MSELVWFGFDRDVACEGWSGLGLVKPGLVGFDLGRARAGRSGQVRYEMGRGCLEVVCSGLSMVGVITFNNGTIGLIKVGITVWIATELVGELRADHGRSGIHRGGQEWSGWSS